MDRGGEKERGRMKVGKKLTLASWKLQTDKQTGSSLLLEVMASNMIKHVNRSQSLNTAIAELECFHQNHTYCAYTRRK